MSTGDLSATELGEVIRRAAGRDPGSGRSKPIEFEMEGVHFVAYRRACFVLRQDAVELMRTGSTLLVHARPPDGEWRVYAFDRDELREALGVQMVSSSYRKRGWYGFTTIPERLDAFRVTP